MKYYVEESLRNFDFWSGAKDTADALTLEQIDQIESMLEDCEPGDGWSDTAINDFFWFESDTIAEWLGFRDWEDLENGGEDEDEEEDEEEEEEDEDENETNE